MIDLMQSMVGLQITFPSLTQTTQNLSLHTPLFPKLDNVWGLSHLLWKLMYRIFDLFIYLFFTVVSKHELQVLSLAFISFCLDFCNSLFSCLSKMSVNLLYLSLRLLTLIHNRGGCSSGGRVGHLLIVCTSFPGQS